MTGGADAGAPAGLSVREVSKRFKKTTALDGVSLDVQPGEIVAVTGPSGAGKSTLGRLISGLESLDTGYMDLNGQRISQLPPQRRRIAHMFESLALYPTINVFDNVASPLRAPSHAGRVPKGEVAQRVMDVLELTEIAHLKERLPSELSGGQKQRVALCRTLVQLPELFVLDEPIGHLDAKLRHKLRGEIRRRQQDLPQGTLWLTPDAVEAMAVADRVVMLVDGQVRQIGTPNEVYSLPEDTGVARLVGDPAMNLIPVELDTSAGTVSARCNDKPLTLDAGLLDRLQALGAPNCVLGIPPLRTGLVSSTGERDDAIQGEIYSVEPFGKYTLVTVDLGGTRVKSKAAPDFRMSIGDSIAISIPSEYTLLFDGETGRRVPESREAAPEGTALHQTPAVLGA